MTALDYISETVSKHKMHMTLLDPDKQSPERAGEMAAEAVAAGTHAIMIGGSDALDRAMLDETARRVKQSAGELPVILFPTMARALTGEVDAIYFMSLLNSKTPDFIMRQQKLGAPLVKKLGIEPIPMGYLVIEPGKRVAEVGLADILPRDANEDAAAYCLAAQYLGMRLVYLEAGSGAEVPVAPEMIAAVKRELDIPVIVGGGIRTPEEAETAARAGADIIVTGTLAEDTKNLRETLAPLIEAILRC